MFLGDGLKNLKATLLTVFILLIPTQLGYHFWPQWSYVFGIRVDYLSPTIYLTDLLIGILAVIWIFEKKEPRRSRRLSLWLILLGLFACINIITSGIPEVAFFKWLKIAELVFVAFMIFKDTTLNLYKTIVLPLSIAAVFIFCLAVVQLILQRSLGGPMYFLGERSFYSGTPGISLYSVFGKLLLRPYSIFSHPNSLAGFSGVALMLLLGLGKELKIKRTIWVIGAAACLGALLLSGSRAALGGLVLSLGALVLLKERKKLYQNFLLVAVFITIFVGILFPVLADKTLASGIEFSERFSQRLVLGDIAGRLYSREPIKGLGLNNFIPEAANLRANAYYPWTLQPVHNVPLLVLAETGIIGYGILIWLLIALVKRALTMQLFFGLAIVFILVTASMDHYWFTLQQNQLLLAVFVGIVLRLYKGKYLLN